MIDLHTIRHKIRAVELADSSGLLARLIRDSAPSDRLRADAKRTATDLIEAIRSDSTPGLMEVFLAEYGLSTDEGIALMCLAEALLRVPDADTIDDLIEDKIAPAAWGRHLGHSSSSLVNASTWALMLTGKVLDEAAADGVAGDLQQAVKRLGEPVIRTAVKQAMRELGRQFVLGETIDDAMSRAAGMEADGYTYSYDMLGEAALTAADAADFFDSYAAAIKAIASRCTSGTVRENPGISVKLSALHPRYEMAQSARVMKELAPRLLDLCLRAKAANMGLNVDAEEADRLDLSLDVIADVVADPRLAGWDGFGVVVQAYGKRAAFVIDWLAARAETHDRRFMVRLVKGAYWDTEIKRAQVAGLDDYPVFTRKAETDVSYLCCAQKLLNAADRLYPQFATHNAHSVAAILEMAGDDKVFEFQRLHGMGESLYRHVRQRSGAACRIYAPVGAHRDLLAYLVRRLLENGANSSFVNQIVDDQIPPEVVAADPFIALDQDPPTALPMPVDLFAPDRRNAIGWDITSQTDRAKIDAARTLYKDATWNVGPIMAAAPTMGPTQRITSPSDPSDTVGTVVLADAADATAALAAATPWAETPADRAAALNRAADAYEAGFGEFFAVLAREAGKTPMDAVAEVREAVDFLRYYASRIDTLGDAPACGTFVCISPWNFPLAIFTGQIAAALAAGNAVIAKPAEQTPITAWIATTLLHNAGVPRDALQLLPGDGATVGAALTGDPRTQGVCFTGSTETAHRIHRSMADGAAATAPLIAETGGLNAMIVDSTALPEQAVRDIIASAFQSAGQRCSALRVLYVQEDIAASFNDMLFGAMAELALGDPWDYATDVGPVIDTDALDGIRAHIDAAQSDGRLLKQLPAPSHGTFIGPTAIKVDGIGDLEKEIFGPVLHIATFRAAEIDNVVADINATGYGLTFGLHTRIDDRVAHLTEALCVGNMYINRNQIGAVVGSQPFGGEGLSGTGPKAGGPDYLKRFTRYPAVGTPVADAPPADSKTLTAALGAAREAFAGRAETFDLPGPTGESNRLSVHSRGIVLCLGPTPELARDQADIAIAEGCSPIIVAPGATGPNAIDGALRFDTLTTLPDFDAVALWADNAGLSAARQALAARDGQIIPLLSGPDDMRLMCTLERHVCIDTTAAGGNASLLASSA